MIIKKGATMEFYFILFYYYTLESNSCKRFVQQQQQENLECKIVCGMKRTFCKVKV